MSLLRNLSFVTESPPLAPIPSLFPTPLRSRSSSLLPVARRKRTKQNSYLLLLLSLSSVHAMILLFSWLVVNAILGCGEPTRISFRFSSSLFGGVTGGRGGGGGEPTW